MDTIYIITTYICIFHIHYIYTWYDIYIYYIRIRHVNVYCIHVWPGHVTRARSFAPLHLGQLRELHSGCESTQMSCAWCSRHVCCVTQQRCLLRSTAEFSVVWHGTHRLQRHAPKVTRVVEGFLYWGDSCTWGKGFPYLEDSFIQGTPVLGDSCA